MKPYHLWIFFLHNRERRARSVKGIRQQEKLFSFLIMVRIRNPMMGTLQLGRGALPYYQFNLQYCKSVSHLKSFEEADLHMFY